MVRINEGRVLFTKASAYSFFNSQPLAHTITHRQLRYAIQGTDTMVGSYGLCIISSNTVVQYYDSIALPSRLLDPSASKAKN